MLVMVKDMEISWDIMGYRNTPLNMDIMGCKYTTVFVFPYTNPKTGMEKYA